MKYILLIVFLLLSISITAQEKIEKASDPPSSSVNLFLNPQKQKPGISKDKISSDGERYIWGNFRVSYVGSSVKENFTSVSIVGIQKDMKEYSLICFRLKNHDNEIHVSEGSPILLKLGDDKVIQTRSLYDANDIGTIEKGMYSVYTSYCIYVYAELTEEILNGLKKGLKKIRFEVNNDIYDVEPRKDNLSQFILDEYALVQEALKTKRSFNDDF